MRHGRSPTIALLAVALSPPLVGSCSCSAEPALGLVTHPVASFASAPPPSAPHEEPAPPRPAEAGAPSVRVIGRCEHPGGVQRFTLAHVNDLQARYGESIAGKSRYAYIAGYLRSLKEAGPTLVLDAGDDYEKGSIAELRSAGEATRLMVQALPIDARVIGNHDFAYGEAALLRDVTASAHPVLAANLRRGQGGPWPFLPYVQIDVGCVKVGIVGLVTRGYGADDEQDHEPYLGIFHQDDGYLGFLYEQHRLHRGDVDVLVALTHLGRYFDWELAKAHGGYDFFVGAHSEDLLGDLEADRTHNKAHAYVMQAGHYGRYIGKADVAVYPDGRVALEAYRFVPVDESLPVADDVDALAADVERKYAPDAHVAIATMKEPIDSGQGMAELVARAAHATWGTDGVLIGTDVFFDGLPKGPVTLQRLYDAVLVQKEPSGTTGFSSLYLAELSGAELAALRPKLRGSFVLLGAPDEPAPEKTYKIAVEKRALSYPTMAFGEAGRGKLGAAAGRFAGELIDLLEAYARATTARGETL